MEWERNGEEEREKRGGDENGGSANQTQELQKSSLIRKKFF